MSSRQLLLQPVSAGDLIDRSLRLYRRQFASLLAIAAATGLIRVVGGLLMALYDDDLLIVLAGGLMTYALAQILSLMIIGGLCKVVTDHMTSGEAISFLQTWRVILRHWWRLFATATLGWILLPMVFIFFAVISMIIGATIVLLTTFLFSTLITQTSTILASIPIIMLTVMLLLAAGFIFLEVYARVVMMPAAAIMEQQPAGIAFSRGLRLGARTSPKVLAVLAFQYCLMWSIATALGVPLSIYAALEGVSLGPNAPEAIATVFNILTQFGALLAAPVTDVAFVLLYFDNRVRKEGLDVEMLALDMHPASEREITPTAPAAGGLI